MSFRQLRRAILGANRQHLALEETRAEVLAAVGLQLARGERVPDDRLAAAFGADDVGAKLRSDDRGDNAADARVALAAKLARPQLVKTGPRSTVAVVSFRGLVNYAVEFQPMAVSTRLFVRTMRELAESTQVSSIVVVVDSPGGLVVGTPEAADALFAARQAKKVIAVVDPLAASAAYWVASQASEIVAMPTGDVGSIGVRMVHMDCAGFFGDAGIKITQIFSGEFKTEGSMFEPLGDVARARFQAESDAIYADFLAAVARGRGVSVAEVRTNYGKGRVVTARDAKRAGMIDRIDIADDALARLGLAGSAAIAGEAAHEVEAAQAGAEPAERLLQAQHAGDEPENTQQPLPDPDAHAPDASPGPGPAPAEADLDRRRRWLDTIAP